MKSASRQNPYVKPPRNVYDERQQGSRVIVACDYIRDERNKDRKFETCFEMGDGDAVAARVYAHALGDAELMAAISNSRYVNHDVFRVLYEGELSKIKNVNFDEIKAANEKSGRYFFQDKTVKMFNDHSYSLHCGIGGIYLAVETERESNIWQFTEDGDLHLVRFEVYLHPNLSITFDGIDDASKIASKLADCSLLLESISVGEDEYDMVRTAYIPLWMIG